MDQPILSIIIPAHNVARYLPRCVESILKQDALSCEVILVDDGSTDETGEICDRYAALDNRVRVLHRHNLDLAATRNDGMDAAEGEYLTFVDGDDMASPELLEKLASVLDRNHPDLIRYGFRTIAEDGAEKDWILPYDEGIYSGERLHDLRLDGIYPANVLDYSVPRVLSVSAHLMRRALLVEHGFRFVSPREVLNEDYLFLLQVLYAAQEIYCLPRILYFYLARSGSLSRSPQPAMMERKKKLIDAYRRVLPKGDPEADIRLRNFYIDAVYDCFVNACTQSASRTDAMERIRPLLQDPELHRCIRENKSRIVSAKTKAICFLMEHCMGMAMYECYRVLARRK